MIILEDFSKNMPNQSRQHLHRSSSLAHDNSKNPMHQSPKLLRNQSCSVRHAPFDLEIKKQMCEAIRKNNVSMVKKLLDAGLQPNEILGDFMKGQTCLHLAASQKATAVVILLVEWIQEHLPLMKKIFANIPDAEGNTPAMISVMRDSPECLYAMKDLCIQTNIENRRGETIRSLAEVYSPACLLVLEDVEVHPPEASEIEKSFEEVLKKRRGLKRKTLPEISAPQSKSVQVSKKTMKYVPRSIMTNAAVVRMKTEAASLNCLDRLEPETDSMTDTGSITFDDRPIGNVLEMKYSTDNQLKKYLEALTIEENSSHTPKLKAAKKSTGKKKAETLSWIN